MAKLESIRDFLAQHHDLISKADATVMIEKAEHYALPKAEGPELASSSLGFIMGIYLPLFLKFEKEPSPEIPDPMTYSGAI